MKTKGIHSQSQPGCRPLSFRGAWDALEPSLKSAGSPAEESGKGPFTSGDLGFLSGKGVGAALSLASA